MTKNKGRKIGRNLKKCRIYKESGRREKNKKRRRDKLLKKFKHNRERRKIASLPI